jgi:YceI-like domain
MQEVPFSPLGEEVAWDRLRIAVVGALSAYHAEVSRTRQARRDVVAAAGSKDRETKVESGLATMDEVVPVFFAQGATEVPSGTWTVDSVHSVASFAVRHMMVGTFRGEFSEIDATLTGGKLIGKVKVASLQIKDETSRPTCSHLTSLTSSASQRSSTSRPHSRSTTASLAARAP